MVNENFKSSADILKAFPDEQSCLMHLEKLRWANHVVSPFNPFSKVYKCSGGNYRCSATGKYFNVKTGTLFYNSKVELQKWFIAIWIVTVQNRNISSIALGQELEITQKTAWFMLQRIKVYFNLENQPKKRKSKAKTSNDVAVIEENALSMLDWLQSLKK